VSGARCRAAGLHITPETLRHTI